MGERSTPPSPVVRNHRIAVRVALEPVSALHRISQAATALLSRVGYRRFDPPPDISDEQLRLVMPLRKDLGFVHEATGVRIELH